MVRETMKDTIVLFTSWMVQIIQHEMNHRESVLI